MKRNCVFIWLFLLGVVFSCNNVDIDPVLKNENNNDLRIHKIVNQGELEGGIDAEKSTLSEVDALRVAKLFNSGAVEARSGDPKSIKQLMSISDSSGEPLMFVVNFDDDRGYVIISATKNMHAILAYSDEGNFDNSYFNTGMSTYIDEFKYGIKEVINKDIDSLRIKYALSWRLFEQQNADLNVSTRSAADDKRRQEVLKWEGLGYDCFPLSHLSAYVGSSEAQNIIYGLCNNTNTNYDCMSSAILLVGLGTTSTDFRLMNTAWHQGAPFNINATNGKAGCWPVAIAQIMKYHEHPKTYNWADIAVNPANNKSFNDFILDVREKCKAIYYKDHYYYGTATAVYDNDAASALYYFGYNTSWNTYNASSYSAIKNSLNGRNPVLMTGRGIIDGKDVEHAWIAHGYKEYHYEIGIAYIPRSSNEYAKMHVKNDGIYNEYVNMNWGWGYNSDYVLYNSAKPTRENFEFSSSRKYILVTKK